MIRNARCGFGCESFGFLRSRRNKRGADAGVRANERALVALNAVFHDPFGNGNRNAAFFVFGRARGYGAVGIERRRGQLVAFQSKDGRNHVAEIIVVRKRDHLCAFRRGRPRCGNVDLDQMFFCRVDRVVVHLHDRVALSRKRLVSHFLHQLNRFRVGHNLFVDAEERRLQNGVGSAAETELFRNGNRVDHIELRLFLGKRVFDLGGKVLFQLFHARPRSVQQESAAFFQIADHVVANDIRGVVAGNEVRRVDKVFALNGGLAEAQVRNGDAARFLGIVEEISLRVHIGMIADDLDRVFVRAHRAVRSETVEFARGGAFGRGVVLFREIERGVRHVLVNTDGEVVFGLLRFEVLVNRKHHGRVEFFRAETVSSADDLNAFRAFFKQRGANVEVKGFAERAGFLRSVEHGDFFAGFGNAGNEFVRNEGAVKTDFDQAVFLAFGVELVDGFFHRFRARTHDDDHFFRVLRADVIEEVVFSARERAHFVHHLLHDRGSRVVVAVRRFAVLEIGVAVLRRTALNGVFGVQSARFEFLYVFFKTELVEEGFHFAVFDRVDLGNLVRSTETVEEVNKGNARTERGEVRDERKVHNFLHAVACEHRKARLAACHHVGMVAEDVQRVSGKRARRYVHDHGQQFARDLVHIGDHEQKPLRSGISRGKRARGQRTVHRAGGAALRLHFGNAELLPPHIEPTLRRPFVGGFRHGGRRGDGIDGSHFRERVSDVRGGGIAVNSHLCHRTNLQKKL